MKKIKQQLIDDLLPHHSEVIKSLIINNHCQNIDLKKITEPSGFLYSLIRSLFRDSETMIAYDVLQSTYIKYFSEALGLNLFEVYSRLDEHNRVFFKSLKQLEGQILQNLHLYESAITVYQALMKLAEADKTIDEETQSNYASTLKSFSIFQDDTNKLKLRKQSFELYYAVYKDDKEKYWSGINASFLAMLSGNFDLADDISAEVSVFCKQKIQDSSDDDFWLTGTLAESLLINCLVKDDKAKLPEVIDVYNTVKRQANSFQELQSVRKNLLLLLEEDVKSSTREVLDEIINTCIPIDSVCVFSGHRIDESHQEQARFPVENIPLVSNAISDFIKNSNIGISYSSLSNGADILFVDSMKALSKKSNVIIPYDLDQFKNCSVSKESFSSEQDNWEKRFNEIEKNEYVQFWITSIAKIFKDLEEVHYHYANQIILGLAILKARELNTDLQMLTVWDGNSSEYIGGTAYFANYIMTLGYNINVIDPKSGSVKLLSYSVQKNKKQALPDVHFKTAVFADVAGFSKFTEFQVKQFFDIFYTKLAEVISACKQPALESNTWGDGLYFVFSSVAEAGDFSLRVCEMVKKYNELGYWKEHQLPQVVEIRISMHCGPVQSVYDPIVKKQSYSGSHVSFTARIEPITPPNTVYASLGAAAISTLDSAAKFYCEYVGTAPLAKKYGACQLFAVRRKAE